MSDLTVRDHSKPCKHGHTTPHGKMWGPTVCPGGREIRLRHVLTWDTQDSLTIDWQPGFNGKRMWVEVDDDE